MEANGKRRGRKIPWTPIVVGAVAILALAFFMTRGHAPTAPYRTAKVDRGSIAQSVSATGQLQPVTSFQVGSTVSGPVKSVEVDFNDVVKKGQVLARIDPDTFEQRVRQLQASLAQSIAAENQARAELARYQTLAKAGFASSQQLLQQQTAVAQQEASVKLARAQLASAQVDLDRSVIRSPADGVVVDRQVDPGQSVAASFSAPKLFVIAQDLSKLEAAILVDEADIGGVLEGMQVRFTVDAYPNESFTGTVSQVRKQGAQNSGVVSYTVIVLADNPRGRLLPGMTANAEIVIAEKANALRVPNAALRFQPSDPKLQAQAKALGGQGSGSTQGGRGEGRGPGGGQGGGGGRMLDRLAEQLKMTPDQRAKAEAAFENARNNAGPFPGPDADEQTRRAFMRKMREQVDVELRKILTPDQIKALDAIRAARGGEGAARQAVLWVLKDDKPTPVKVQLGIAADAYTELLSGLDEGADVITGGGPVANAAQSQNGARGGPPGAVRVRGF